MKERTIVKKVIFLLVSGLDVDGGYITMEFVGVDNEEDRFCISVFGWEKQPYIA